MTNHQIRKRLLRINHDTGIISVSKVPADTDRASGRCCVWNSQESSDKTADRRCYFKKPYLTGNRWRRNINFFAFACITSAIVNDSYTYIIISGLQIAVDHLVIAGIIFRVLYTGISSISKLPANGFRFFI